MKSIFFLIPFAGLCLFGCKKNDPKPTEVTDYSGWFYINKIIYNPSGGSPTVQEGGFAIFYNPAVDMAAMGPDSLLELSGVSAGTVYLNGQEMTIEYDELDSSRLAYHAYADEAPWQMDSNLVFQIGGSSGIPSFTYNAPGDFLKFTPSFPDTITAASGYTLNFGVAGTGADSLSVVFSGTSGAQVVKTYAPGTANVVFSPAELSSLGSGMGFLSINLVKQDTYETGGKKYLLTGEYSIIWMLGLN